MRSYANAYVYYMRFLSVFLLLLIPAVLLIGPFVWNTMAPVDCFNNICPVK